MKNFLKKLFRGTTNLIGWGIVLPLVSLGTYFAITNWEKMKPVEIVEANKITATEVKTDYVANRNSSKIQDVKERFSYMIRDTENDSLFKAFAGQLDSMNLTTIAQKAFAIDSLVDAQIKTESDYRLYGEYHWATGIETVRFRRGDDKNRSLLKDALMEHAGIASHAFLSVVSKDPAATDEKLVVMIDTAAAGNSPYGERFILDNDSGGKLTQVSEKKYGYQVAFVKDSIIYITPADGPNALK